MKSLSFMRHAESDLNFYNNDFNRPIKNLFKNNKNLCGIFKKNNIKFDFILFSCTKAKQTSNYFLSVMNLKTIKVLMIIIYEGCSENFLLKTSNLKKYQDILIITHELKFYFLRFFFLLIFGQK